MPLSRRLRCSCRASRSDALADVSAGIGGNRACARPPGEHAAITTTPTRRGWPPTADAEPQAGDPQFLPESNLRFALSAPLIARVYLGDALSFAVYAMASQPALYERIRAEADALLDNGDPDADAFTPDATDVTRRFVMECMRMYPIVPISVRNVMKGCIVEDHEIPVGTRIFIAQAAAHYMPDVFPEPFTFRIAERRRALSV